MANTTDPFAEAVHGTNPQNLIEKITRLKIYNSNYWKEECFGLTAETVVDKAICLKYFGGTYGGNLQPTKFLCLLLKMLQLQPEKDIILEFIKNEDFKYLRLLGAFYLRLVGKPDDVYQYLEPLYNDYRKIIFRGTKGFELKHIDELIDMLLTEELVCDIALPYVPKRLKLEETGILEVRRSVLEDDIEDDDEDEDGEERKSTANIQNKSVGTKGIDKISNIDNSNDKETLNGHSHTATSRRTSDLDNHNDMNSDNGDDKGTNKNKDKDYDKGRGKDVVDSNEDRNRNRRSRDRDTYRDRNDERDRESGRRRSRERDGGGDRDRDM
eukprot:gene34823-45049_t